MDFSKLNIIILIILCLLIVIVGIILYVTLTHTTIPNQNEEINIKTTLTNKVNQLVEYVNGIGSSVTNGFYTLNTLLPATGQLSLPPYVPMELYSPYGALSTYGIVDGSSFPIGKTISITNVMTSTINTIVITDSFGNSYLTPTTLPPNQSIILTIPSLFPSGSSLHMWFGIYDVFSGATVNSNVYIIMLNTNGVVTYQLVTPAMSLFTGYLNNMIGNYILVQVTNTIANSVMNSVIQNPLYASVSNLVTKTFPNCFTLSNQTKSNQKLVISSIVIQDTLNNQYVPFRYSSTQNQSELDSFNNGTTPLTISLIQCAPNLIGTNGDKQSLKILLTDQYGLFYFILLYNTMGNVQVVYSTNIDSTAFPIQDASTPSSSLSTTLTTGSFFPFGAYLSFYSTTNQSITSLVIYDSNGVQYSPSNTDTTSGWLPIPATSASNPSYSLQLQGENMSLGYNNQVFRVNLVCDATNHLIIEYLLGTSSSSILFQVNSSLPPNVPPVLYTATPMLTTITCVPYSRPTVLSYGANPTINFPTSITILNNTANATNPTPSSVNPNPITITYLYMKDSLGNTYPNINNSINNSSILANLQNTVSTIMGPSKSITVSLPTISSTNFIELYFQDISNNNFLIVLYNQNGHPVLTSSFFLSNPTNTMLDNNAFVIYT